MSHAKRRIAAARAKREPGGFVPLPHCVVRSQQFARLSPHAVKLLCDLLGQYTGHSNGSLCATWSVMQARGWRSRDTLGKALRELIGAGWIAQTRQGGLHAASLYGITFYGLDESAQLDVRAAAFPRGAWARGGPDENATPNTRGVSTENATPNTPRVSQTPKSTRGACQLSPSQGSIDTRGVRVSADSPPALTRRAGTSIELPSPGSDGGHPTPAAMRATHDAMAVDPPASPQRSLPAGWELVELPAVAGGPTPRPACMNFAALAADVRASEAAAAAAREQRRARATRRAAL